MSDKIREQIATCRRNADDQTMCGVDVGRTGPCHGAWQWDDVADSLQFLLDENERLKERAEKAEVQGIAEGRIVAKCNARIEKLEKVREAAQEEWDQFGAHTKLGRALTEAEEL